MSDKGELPYKKMVEVTGDDGSTAWINLGPFGGMDKFKKINFEEPEVSITEGVIGRLLMDVLGRIPNNLPASFREKATKLANWMTLLDRGVKVEEEDFENWLEQIRSNQVRPLLGIYPKEAFAPWMLDNIEECQLPSSEEELQQRELFTAMTAELGLAMEKESNGIFLNLKQSETLKPDQIKAYIAESDTLTVLSNGQLKDFLINSDKSDIPFQLKLYEGGIVLYFGGKNDSRASIRGSLQEFGIEVVCAQDTYEYPVKEGRILKPRFVNSKDGTFSTWVMTGNQYNQARYFENYISFCIQYGRSPTDPYMSEFVYVVDDGSLREDDQSLVKLRGASKLPVVIKRSGS